MACSAARYRRVPMLTGLLLVMLTGATGCLGLEAVSLDLLLGLGFLGARSGLADCSTDETFCSAVRCDSTKVQCSCTVDAPGNTFGPSPGNFCLPPGLNAGPNSGSTPQQLADIAANCGPVYDQQIDAFCEQQVANAIAAVFGVAYPEFCGLIPLATITCIATPPGFVNASCDAMCVETVCDQVNCAAVVSPTTKEISPENCACSHAVSCGRDSGLLCQSTPGMGDPPTTDFGPLGGMLAAQNLGSVDPAASQATVTVAFNDIFSFHHSDTAQPHLSGHVIFYGRRRGDGTAGLVIDLALRAEDIGFHFDFLVLPNPVPIGFDLPITSIRIGGGTGSAKVAFDASGMGMIPAGMLSLVVETISDQAKTTTTSSNSQAVMVHVDWANKTFSIPSLSAAFPGVSGTVTVAGTLVNQGPVVDAGQDQTVECESPTGTIVTLDGTGSSDPDGNIGIFNWFEGPAFDPSKSIADAISVMTEAHFAPPLATTTYTLVVGDRQLQLDLDAVDVTVQDTTPPELNVAVSPACLWTPNHKLLLFELGAGFSAEATDVCDLAPKVAVVDATSSQPGLGGGQGNTIPDALHGATSFCLRSERQGTDPVPREYTVTVQAKDASNNTTTKQVVVKVGHDQHPNCTPVDPSRIVEHGDPRCTAP